MNARNTTRPKLSVCIPTYNRAKLLERVLNHVCQDSKFPFATEMVISDNCSSDETTSVAERFRAAGHHVSYFRQHRHVSVEENLDSAFRLGCGEYLIYLADDDLLIANAVERVVGFLDSNPNVVACYAPWELYDYEMQRAVQQSFSVDADLTFDKGAFRGCFEFLIRNHVFPEIGVYRAQAMWDVVAPKHFCYWAFTNLAHLLDQGDVVFHALPFYRSVIRKGPDGREQAGAVQAMHDWDRYRGGIEYLVHVRTQQAGSALTAQQTAEFGGMINAFVLSRMQVALRLWLLAKDFVRAYELFCRLHLWSAVDDPQLQALRPRLASNAAIQSFVEIVRTTSSVDRLVLLGVANAFDVEKSLRELGLDSQIPVVIDPGPPKIEDARRSMVLIGMEDHRKSAIGHGYLPGLVFSQASVLRLLVSASR